MMDRDQVGDELRGGSPPASGRGPLPGTEPQLAFTVAALVLLGLPFLVMVGLAALALAAGTGLALDSDAMLAVFVVWAVLALAAVIGIVAFVVRRASRS
jgi:hypothetical protein